MALLLMLCAATVYTVRWYHGFYHHVTHEELSHAVRHSTFQATIRSGPPLEMHLYQQEHAANQQLVLFASGDGGWSPFCADVAAHIAATGVTVVGVDLKSYLVNFASPQKPISAEDLTSDYNTLARIAREQPGIDTKAPLVLAGWSLGASYSVIVATQPEFNVAVNRIVAISLPLYGERAWKPTDSIIYFTHGTPSEKLFDARQYLKKLNQTPIVFLNATDDDTSPFREAQSLYEQAPGAKHFYVVKAKGHHFEGGEKEFYQDLDLGISLPQIAAKDDNKLKETGATPS
ncbi:MAG TPA: AcvB/VirJ family lysyl-phosphatidylglycerol hydrolase [Pyrinomonadaceae bacterium]